MDLANKKCLPCEGGVEPFDSVKTAEYLALVKGWTVRDDGKKIAKVFLFKDFKLALSFVDNIGAVAESEGHHPDITLSWGRVEVVSWTHSIGGLSENDFILAFKIDHLAT